MSTRAFVGLLLTAPVLFAQLASQDQPPASFGFPGAFHATDPYHTQPGDAETGLAVAPDWPHAGAPQRPIAGVVSLKELEHPIPKKARRAAYRAQKLSKKHKTAQAIAALQEAIRIYPPYRDAHCNLGVQYAREGRMDQARAEFEQALKIGPPAALIYTDLALTFDQAGNLGQAVFYARKALDLDPGDYAARHIVASESH